MHLSLILKTKCLKSIEKLNPSDNSVNSSTVIFSYHFIYNGQYFFEKLSPLPTLQGKKYLAYLKIEESLAKPVVHDGNLCCIKFQRYPNIFCHHCLNQQTRHQDW